MEEHEASRSSDSKKLDELLKQLSVEAKSPAAELAAVDAHVNAGEMQAAYDALLAAMRIAPGDDRIFEASLEFVEAARQNGNDDTMTLALDIHQRAASLIPFLPLTSLQDARSKHVASGDELFATQADASAGDALAEAEDLLAAAGQHGLPGFARARLLSEVEAELGAQARVVATSNFPIEEAESFWKHWKAVKTRYEELQREALSVLYEEDCGPRLRTWSKRVDEFNKKRANTSLDEIHQTNDEILALLVEGQRISRDIAPYFEAGVEAAAKDNQGSGPDKHLAGLAQLREWNYNRWALDRVEKVEQSGGTAFEKLKSLSAIDDARLAPFVGQRFSEVWKMFFDACSKDEQVEATKFRILREYQP